MNFFYRKCEISQDFHKQGSENFFEFVYRSSFYHSIILLFCMKIFMEVQNFQAYFCENQKEYFHKDSKISQNKSSSKTLWYPFINVFSYGPLEKYVNKKI